MIAVGERINGMYSDVKKAIQKTDPAPIQELARRQTEAGASFLDINVGPAAADKVAAMKWLVEVTQDAVDTPLSIDSQTLDVVRAGLEACRGKALINSTKGDPEPLQKYFELAKEFDASLVALTMDERGVPADVDSRVEIAATIVTMAMEAGFNTDALYIDPIVLPVNVAQEQPGYIFETMSQIRILSDPPPHIVVGLSNISQSTAERELINRTFLVMAIAAGLDAAIMDVLDDELMEAAITADMILNKHIYCDSFLKAYRK